MRNIFVIAKHTLKLEIRDKILYAVIAFGLIYVLLNLFLAELARYELPIVKSFGLLGIYLFNVVIALFLGTTSFFKDVDRKVVYFLLAKPVSRTQFLLGKFMGLCLVLLATSAVFAVAYLGIVAYEHGGFDALGLLAIFMQFVELAIFIAFAIFASTFSSSLVSIVYTSAVFFLGHIVSALLTDARAIGVSGLPYRLVEVLYYVLPNLEKFNVRDLAVHAVALPFVSAALALAYAAAYIALLLFAATWIFRRKEI